MILNFNNLQKIQKIIENNNNYMIFNVLLKKLIKINFFNVDQINSKINFLDFNYNEVELTFENLLLNLNNKNFSLCVNLTAKDEKKLELKFHIWNEFVNIYVGESSYHYADDVNIISNLDLNNYEKELYLLFDCFIEEKVKFKKEKIISIDYKFTKNNKIVKDYIKKQRIRLPFTTFSDRIITVEYKPWID